MEWQEKKYSTITTHELSHPQYGVIFYVAPARKDDTWEIEFTVEKMDLYWNEVFCGSLAEAKARCRSLALDYLNEMLSDIVGVRDWVEKEL